MPPHDPTFPAQIVADNTVTAQPQIATPPIKVSYAFVDMVRFLATLGIVYIHSYVPMGELDSTGFYHRVNHAEYYLYVKQLFKFSTICYFLIAGFLLADKSIESSPFDYYIRRLKVIAIPYVLALVLFIAGLTFSGHYTSGQPVTVAYIVAIAKYVMLYSPFWYIPNYLLCLLVIVCFSKYATSVYLGGILFLLTAWNTWYSVYEGSTHTHTTALTGFIFFMWLGMYIKKKNLIAGMQKAGPLVTGTVLVICYLLSDWESRYMFYHSHNTEALNTLRISNQLYSIAFFAFIVSCCRKPANFGPLDPRKETYGIYLYHSFFTFIILVVIDQWLNKAGISFFSYNIYQVLLVNIVSFLISYIATTLVVKFLLRFKLAWLPQM